VPNTSTVIGSSVQNYAGYVSAILRCASIRSRLLTAEIDSIGTALSGNFIDPDTAVALAFEIGAIDLIAASSTVTIPASQQEGQ
jgi:hypothetical protein